MEVNDYISAIVTRIKTTLHSNYQIENKSQLWKWCSDHHVQVDVNRDTLEDMANNTLTWGFMGGQSEHLNVNAIIDLAKAIGVSGIQNPENGDKLHPKTNVVNLGISEILQRIEKKIGFDISCPPFIGNRKTTLTDYGIVTDRHCHYLWILKRIIELCPDRNSRILEVGAGLGLLGYYLDKAGYKDYTTIDLAYPNACQTYFLARNLPERNIIISGEEANPFSSKFKDSLKLLHSTDFIDVPKGRFDLMINIDSLTEMNIEEANKYMQSDCATLLLSINHEVNEFRVNDINGDYRSLKYRYPFWLRAGYVEELYEINN